MNLILIFFTLSCFTPLHFPPLSILVFYTVIWFSPLSFHINYLLHNNYNNASGSAWEQTAVETVPPMAVVVFSLLVCELLLWFINSAKPLCDKLIVLSPPSEYNLKPLREA